MIHRSTRRSLIKIGLVGLASGTGIYSFLKYYIKAYIPQIVTYPNPILRQVSAPIEHIDDTVIMMAQALTCLLRYRAFTEFFLKASLYKGIAAPQIGHSKRLVVCGLNGRMLALVNPEIVEQSGTYANSEYCMSLPHHDSRIIKRCKNVKLSYRALNGRYKTLVAQGSAAGLLQHEIDHLNGQTLH